MMTHASHAKDPALTAQAMMRGACFKDVNVAPQEQAGIMTRNSHVALTPLGLWRRPAPGMSWRSPTEAWEKYSMVMGSCHLARLVIKKDFLCPP